MMAGTRSPLHVLFRQIPGTASGVSVGPFLSPCSSSPPRTGYSLIISPVIVQTFCSPGRVPHCLPDRLIQSCKITSVYSILYSVHDAASDAVNVVIIHILLTPKYEKRESCFLPAFLN